MGLLIVFSPSNPMEEIYNFLYPKYQKYFQIGGNLICPVLSAESELKS